MSRVAVPVRWREILQPAMDGNRNAKSRLTHAGHGAVIVSRAPTGSYELLAARLD